MRLPLYFLLPGAAVLAVVLTGVEPSLVRAAEPDLPPAAKPPYQRLLQGEDARKADELENSISRLAEAHRYAAAVEAAKELLVLRRRVQGDDHWQVIDAKWSVHTLRTLAALPAEKLAECAAAMRSEREARQLEEQARYAQALLLRPKLFGLPREVLGEEHPYTATSYNNMAFNLNAQAKYAEAEPLFRKTLAIWGKTLGPEHPLTSTSYNNVGFNLNCQGKHAEAEALFRPALQIDRKVLGEQQHQTAIDYNNIALTLNAQRRHAEAAGYYRKALAIWQSVFGEQHPHTATGYNNLGRTLALQGKEEQAATLFRKALVIQEKSFGPEHPDTARTRENLAASLADQGKNAEAEPLLRQSLTARLKVLGGEHPDTAANYDNLAINLLSQRRFADAEPLCRAAVASLEAARLRATASGLDRTGYQRIHPRLNWAIALLHTGQPAHAWRSWKGTSAAACSTISRRGKPAGSRPTHRPARAPRCSPAGRRTLGVLAEGGRRAHDRRAAGPRGRPRVDEGRRRANGPGARVAGRRAGVGRRQNRRSARARPRPAPVRAAVRAAGSASEQKNGMTNRQIEYGVIPPEQDAEFVACMGEVLETYAAAYDPQPPVLCMDEQPVQRLKETRVPIAATKEHGQRVDYEYERNGTASIFLFAEPLSGFRQATARERRTKADWAIEVAEILDRRYADCD